MAIGLKYTVDLTQVILGTIVRQNVFNK